MSVIQKVHCNNQYNTAAARINKSTKQTNVKIAVAAAGFAQRKKKWEEPIEAQAKKCPMQRAIAKCVRENDQM